MRISVWFMVYKLLVMYVTGGYQAPTIITAVCELCVYIPLQVSISDETFTLTDLAFLVLFLKGNIKKFPPLNSGPSRTSNYPPSAVTNLSLT